MISSFSISMIFYLIGRFSEKKGLTVFQKKWLNNSYYQDCCNNPYSIYVLVTHNTFSVVKTKMVAVLTIFLQQLLYDMGQ